MPTISSTIIIRLFSDADRQHTSKAGPYTQPSTTPHTIPPNQQYHQHPQEPSQGCCCQEIDYDVDYDDEDTNNNNNNNNNDDKRFDDDYDDYDVIEGRYSPKKVVTFSEYDQIKMMSMDSLLSAATSDASTMEDGANANNGAAISRGLPTRPFGARQGSQPSVVLQDPTINSNTQQNTATPKRNQQAQDQKSRYV